MYNLHLDTVLTEPSVIITAYSSLAIVYTWGPSFGCSGSTYNEIFNVAAVGLYFNTYFPPVHVYNLVKSVASQYKFSVQSAPGPAQIKPVIVNVSVDTASPFK